MTEDRLRSYGVFLLRVALGTMFIAHSTIYMLMTLTLAGTGKFFVSIGLPAWLAYATFFAEAVGGILLILGIQTRCVALAFADPNGCDLGSFRKRLALCRHQWWLGVPPLPFRSLHCAGHARRRCIRAGPIAVERQRRKPPSNR
jgi:hypothetical protein